MNSKRVIAVLSIHLALFSYVACQNWITLGLSLSFQAPKTSFRYTQSVDIRDGLDLWINKVNNQQGGSIINNQTYLYRTKILEDYGNLTLVLQNYNTLLNDTEVNFLLGPINSDFSNPVAAITEQARRIIIATSAGSDLFFQGRRYAFSVVVPASRYLYVSLPYMRLAGANSISLLKELNPFTSGVCDGVTDTVAKQNALSVLQRFQSPSSIDTVTDDMIQNYRNITSALLAADANPDVFVGCMFSKGAAALLQVFKEMNYSPKMIVIAPFTLDFDKIDQSVLNYVTGAAIFDPLANYPNDPVWGSTQEYVRLFNETYNYIPTEYSAFGTMCGYILQEAIQRAQSLDQDVVRDSLSRINLNTFMGQFFFGTDNSNQLSCIYKQYNNASRVIIGPPISQTANAKLIYPFPAWDERVFTLEFDPLIEEWVMYALALFGMVVSIAMIFFVIALRKNPVIKASSPTFLSLMLVGTLLLYCSIWLWNLTYLTKGACVVHMWFLAIGFTLMFGSLFAKSWRVYRLYFNQTLQLVKISDLQLLIVLGAFVVVDVIILAVGTGIVNFEPVEIIVDEFRPVYNYLECPINDTLTAVVATLIAWKAVQSLGGLILAFVMRKIKYSVFNESKVIAFAIYNVVFFSVIIVILQYTNASNRTVLFVIRSVGIFLATGISVGSIFLSKFGNLKADPFSPSARGTSHDTFKRTSISSKDNELKLRNEEQLKRIADLEEENKRLKSLVEQSRAPKSVDAAPINRTEPESLEKNSTSNSSESSSDSDSGSN